MRDIGNILSYIGIAIITVTYVWSFIVGYRQSFWWLIGLFALWIFFYPAFVCFHWQKIRVNFYVFLVGFTITGISFYLLAATNPNNVAVI